MSRFIPVQGFPDFVRDRHTNAILNTNSTAIKLAREQKEIRRQKKREEENMKNKINKMESDIEEIKTLLKMLSENKL